MLKGKTALVTGSTSGIGLGIAQALAAQGANVLLNGFGDAQGAQAQAAAAGQAHGIAVDYHGADMSRPDEIEAMMAFGAQRFGRIDILVNNAGIQHVSPIEEFPHAKWDAILAINLSAVFHTTRLALPAMKAKGWGRVINTASAHSLVASPNKSAYVAAKHGLVGLTRSLAVEVARKGVTVNAVCPGFTETYLLADSVANIMAKTGRTEEQARADLAAGNPQKRLIQPQEVADAVLWLCQPGSGSVTGQAISVSGGEVM